MRQENRGRARESPPLALEWVGGPRVPGEYPERKEEDRRYIGDISGKEVRE